MARSERVIHAATGEILRSLTLVTTKNCHGTGRPIGRTITTLKTATT